MTSKSNTYAVTFFDEDLPTSKEEGMMTRANAAIPPGWKLEIATWTFYAEADGFTFVGLRYEDFWSIEVYSRRHGLRLAKSVRSNLPAAIRYARDYSLDHCKGETQS